MSQRYDSPVVVSAPSQRSIQASGLSQGAVLWGEPLYRNEAMPSLERSDRVHMQGGQEQGCWDSPGSKVTRILQ